MNAKDRAKVFMFVCIGILAISVAYSLGARSVQAQSGGDFQAVTNTVWGTTLAITLTGDCYEATAPGGSATWHYTGNILSIAPVSASSQSMGKTKQQYR